VDSTIRDMVGRRASAVDIKHAAQNTPHPGHRMVTLRDEGLRLVRTGLTTAAEVTRVIEAIDEVET
jgi:type II secretory ATPase GspE/PulE/Tfp pilus assembly ATPase PilB-like protein